MINYDVYRQYFEFHKGCRSNFEDVRKLGFETYICVSKVRLEYLYVLQVFTMGLNGVEGP